MAFVVTCNRLNVDTHVRVKGNVILKWPFRIVRVFDRGRSVLPMYLYIGVPGYIVE